MPGFVYEVGSEYKPDLVNMIWGIFEVFGEDIPLTDRDCGGGKVIRGYRFVKQTPVPSNSCQQCAGVAPAETPSSSGSGPARTKVQTLKKIFSSSKAKKDVPDMHIPLDGTEFELLCWFMRYAKPAFDPKKPLASVGSPPQDTSVVVVQDARATRSRVQMCVDHMFGQGSKEAKITFAELLKEKHKRQ